MDSPDMEIEDDDYEPTKNTKSFGKKDNLNNSKMETSNNSGSEDEVSPSKEKDGKVFGVKVETDRGKRFDYLLKQIEIFAHFMTANQKKDGSSTASATGNTPKKAKSRPRKPKAETGDSADGAQVTFTSTEPHHQPRPVNQINRNGRRCYRCHSKFHMLQDCSAPITPRRRPNLQLQDRRREVRRQEQEQRRQEQRREQQEQWRGRERRGRERQEQRRGRERQDQRPGRERQDQRPGRERQEHRRGRERQEQRRGRERQEQRPGRELQEQQRGRERQEQRRGREQQPGLEQQQQEQLWLEQLHRSQQQQLLLQDRREKLRWRQPIQQADQDQEEMSQLADLVEVATVSGDVMNTNTFEDCQ